MVCSCCAMPSCAAVLSDKWYQNCHCRNFAFSVLQTTLSSTLKETLSLAMTSVPPATSIKTGWRGRLSTVHWTGDTSRVPGCAAGVQLSGI
eukprot:2825118-Rhodomonas_salina.1